MPFCKPYKSTGSEPHFLIFYKFDIKSGDICKLGGVMTT